MISTVLFIGLVLFLIGFIWRELFPLLVVLGIILYGHFS